MAQRESWKGFLKIAEVTCPVSLYTAVSISERIAFHMVNRETGQRLLRKFVDSETGDPVEKDDQVKGYEVESGRYVMIEPEEIAAAVPDGDKTLDVQSFVECATIDHVYFDKPYYLAPSVSHARESFELIREGLRVRKVAALATSVLFRRVRSLLIQASDAGLVATTLNFDYEVRAAKDVFGSAPNKAIKGEMLELAKHIIRTKRGKFDPEGFDDRYEAALADLVKAKMEGRAIEVRKPPSPTNVVDLMAALRESAGAASPKKQAAKATRPKPVKKPKAPVRKSGPKRRAS